MLAPSGWSQPMQIWKKDKMHTLQFNANQVRAVGLNEAIDLALVEQDVCMLSGPSGSGKSQFLKALADLIEHEGEVFLNGKEANQCMPHEWRAQVMYFAAETAWWGDSVKEHFTEIPDADALKSIGLKEQMLNENPDTLSSGEKQRLALLRGLQYKPKVLLLDEVTANLDPASEALVEQLIKAYLTEQSAAAIWISHAPAQIERMATQQRVFNLQNVAQDQTQTEALA